MDLVNGYTLQNISEVGNPAGKSLIWRKMQCVQLCPSWMKDVELEEISVYKQYTYITMTLLTVLRDKGFSIFYPNPAFYSLIRI